MNECLINTDTMDGPGIHWVALHIDKDGRRWLYDPLGPKNDRCGLDDVIRPDFIYPVHNQSKESNICGWLSILAAKAMGAHTRSIHARADRVSANPFDRIRKIIKNDGTD